ncbi:MAG: hypothetical protein WAQ28_02020 [Bacteroidia bacterium]
MKLSKVSYPELEVLFKITSIIGEYIQEEAQSTRSTEGVKKSRLHADFGLARELAKKFANKMINIQGNKTCTIVLKDYEAVLFTDYLGVCNSVIDGYGVVVFEKHIMHIYKELFTRNIIVKNDRQH